ncbi:GntR family transcriptional regulator [Corynebacterium imitans]|uniref:GntR family transcriptional regulator n=1 Tax=Corynebacterium imitans TaxID=156978 RepID=UPI00254FF3E7|nr:GntR family transcriptional regulator [Corynebacterium imitans]MDK8307290.1 GntR family transcriptional regulator [Corynebacterium imitans]MDK8636227.1 GntR family transcriptional regulator [Corynebacterium imitans]MDK8771425.1 GntR family transcriptional regulator [Corynebacterium imitans]
MTRKADSVVDYVREAIQSRAMKPGEWYSVTQLAEEMGVSRSPVREGLLKLQEAGLVRFAKNRGFEIVETGASDVAEIFAIRLGLEPPAAYRAASLRTPEQLAEVYRLMAEMQRCADQGDETEFFVHDRALHVQLYVMSGSRYGQGVMERLRDITGILGHTTAGTSRTLHDILNEHRPIIEAIIAGDPAEAAATMREHLTITGKLLTRQALLAEIDEGERETADAWATEKVDEIWASHVIDV